MDNSIDMLLTRAEEKNSRVIYRFSPAPGMIPNDESDNSKSRMSGIASYGTQALVGISDRTAAVIFDYPAFAFYGVEGLMTLSMLLTMAKNLGLYVILDGCFGGEGALRMCEASFYAEPELGQLRFPADAVTLSPYCAAKDLKAIAVLCREEDKAAFIWSKMSRSGDEDTFENIKTDGKLRLYQAAIDDAGAFGESYVGEKGYSVLGFITVPPESLSEAQEMRDLDRWGIALVKADAKDLDDANTYAFFYPKECEGQFTVLTDSEMAAELDLFGDKFDSNTLIMFFKTCVEKAEKKRLEKK